MKMTRPTTKSPAIDSFITSIMGKDRRETIIAGDCMTCNNKCIDRSTQSIDENFRDDCSIREYHISGMCQECQDNAFGESK
tara:strand:- start:145 stop:387 length:243 start_codon:yes stop_codon:yes gene_type:complete